MQNPLTIGQLAKRLGINLETIRFYERKKLIQRPSPQASGYRCYSSAIVDDILFIRRAKGLGFSLQEISELLHLRSDPRGNAADVKKVALAKISDIEEKMKSLEKMRSELLYLANVCPGAGPISRCPIIKALESRT